MFSCYALLNSELCFDSLRAQCKLRVSKCIADIQPCYHIYNFTVWKPIKFLSRITVSWEGAIQIMPCWHGNSVTMAIEAYTGSLLLGRLQVGTFETSLVEQLQWARNFSGSHGNKNCMQVVISRSMEFTFDALTALIIYWKLLPLQRRHLCNFVGWGLMEFLNVFSKYILCPSRILLFFAMEIMLPWQ